MVDRKKALGLRQHFAAEHVTPRGVKRSFNSRQAAMFQATKGDVAYECSVCHRWHLGTGVVQKDDHG